MSADFRYCTGARPAPAPARNLKFMTRVWFLIAAPLLPTAIERRRAAITPADLRTYL